jgi:Holliday junction resolvase RusA-like endonuclease
VLCVDAFALRVEVSRPGARLCKPDPDNVAKLHLDALSDAGCIIDDARCRSLSVDVRGGPEQVRVTLTACL